MSALLVRAISAVDTLRVKEVLLFVSPPVLNATYNVYRCLQYCLSAQCAVLNSDRMCLSLPYLV